MAVKAVIIGRGVSCCRTIRGRVVSVYHFVKFKIGEDLFRLNIGAEKYTGKIVVECWRGSETIGEFLYHGRTLKSAEEIAIQRIETMIEDERKAEVQGSVAK